MTNAGKDNSHPRPEGASRFPETVDEVRSWVANRSIFVFAAAGFIGLAASLSRAREFGWHNLFYLHILVYSLFLIAAILHRRLSFRCRAYLLLSLWFLLGTFGLVAWGLLSAGVPLLITSCIFAAVLLGTRAGAIASAASLAVMSLVAMGVNRAYITFDFDLYAYATAPSVWTVNILATGFIIAVVVSGLTRLNDSLVGSIDALTVRTFELRQSNDKLKEEMAERARTEEALRESEERYRTLIDSLPVIVLITDYDSKLLYANPALEKQTGYSIQNCQMIGEKNPLVHPDDGDRLSKFIADFAASNQQYSSVVDKRFIDKWGKTHWYASILTKVDYQGRPALQFVARDITWRKEAEEEVRKSESKIRAILDALPDLMFVLSADGTFIDFKGSEELLAVDPKGIVGRNLSDALPEDLAETALQALEKTLETGFVQTLAYDITTRDGELRSFEARNAPCGNEVLVLVRDITDRKRAEERLRESEERYRTFVEQITEGIWRCELETPCPTDLPEEEQAVHILEHSVLAECNETLARLYGFSGAKELIGKHISTFVPPEPEVIESLRDFIRSNYRIAQVETKEWDRKGHRKHFSNSRLGITEGGYLVRVWGTTRDITEMKRAEEEILISRERLRALTMQLSAVEEQERRRFAAYLHDQIGQSLAVVQMRLGELSASCDLETSTQNIQGTRSLIDEVIENTRTLTFDLSPPVLYELGLGPAVEWISEKISKEHELDFEFQDDGRAKPLEADTASLLFRSARELLMNVAKHARASSIKATVGRDDGSVFVTIQDDGVGFDTSVLEPRAGESRFGLFSIRERMDYIGGRMEIHSEPEKGTQVTLFAPSQWNSAPPGSLS